MAVNTIGTQSELVKAMNSASKDVETAQTALVSAFKGGKSAADLQELKLAFEEKAQRFQALLGIFDVISRLKDRIIQSIGQIGR